MTDEGKAVLAALNSLELHARVMVLSTYTAMHRVLDQSAEVSALRAAIKDKVITEKELRLHVEGLLADFQTGERFKHEIPVACIAVALASFFQLTHPSWEFLEELSKLKIAEMSWASNIAKHALRQHDRKFRDAEDDVDQAPAPG
jgi:hypothetical protein